MPTGDNHLGHPSHPSLSLADALAADRETDSIEFKTTFDPASRRDWCELIKDIVAIANSGGGFILIGLDSHGRPAGADPSAARAVDPATIVDKIRSYTGIDFSAFRVSACEKAGSAIFALDLHPSPEPLAFESPGTYDTGRGQQRTAFAKGTLYVRHNAKSEPATNQDIARIIRAAEERGRQLAAASAVAKMSEESIDEVLARLDERIGRYKAEALLPQADVYRGDEIPHTTQQLVAAYQAIDKQLRGLHFSYAGGWAGMGYPGNEDFLLAIPIENILDSLEESTAIGKPLASQIRDFSWHVTLALHGRRVPEDESRALRHLAAKILAMLEAAPRGPAFGSAEPAR